MVIIEFWIQPVKKGKKYKFKHHTSNSIKSIDDAIEEISHYTSSSKTQANMTIHTIHKKSAIMIAMESLRIDSNYNFGIISYTNTTENEKHNHNHSS